MSRQNNPHRSLLSRRSQLALVIVTLVALLIPGVAQYQGLQFFSSDFENRYKHELPDWPETAREYAKFPKRFDRWYSDHFGLRNSMIKLYVLAKFYLLGAIQVNTVVLGDDGWLFFKVANPEADPIASYRGTNLFEEDELAAMANNLSAWDAWCRARGISFVFVVAPNKSAIFPEHLPAGIAPAPRPNRLAQFLEYMKTHSSALIVEPSAHLKRHKDEYIYFKTDSHWTALGAMYATQAIRDAVADDLARKNAPWAPIELTDFNKTVTPRDGGDLAHMLIMAKSRPEQEIFLTPLDDRNATAAAQGLERPKAILYGDSFSVYLPPFLAQDFDLVYPPINSRLDPQFIEEQAPVLLIFELVERNLYDLADITRKINFTEGRVTPQPPPWADLNRNNTQ